MARIPLLGEEQPVDEPERRRGDGDAVGDVPAGRRQRPRG